MEYTVQKLAKLAGISSRTLRYYDEIGLLKPARISSSGYRLYGRAEVDRLQQILFYRELGIELEQIKRIITAPSFDKRAALCEHHARLLDKKKRLELLIANVEKTIAETEGRIRMTDKEKFEGFKKKMLAENEAKYGREIREKYGEENVARSNEKFMNMTEEQYAELQELTERLNETLKQAVAGGEPAGELAQKACELHKKWLLFFWPQYSKEAHMGLAQMYVDDSRFTAYYEKIAPGCAAFLRDAMRIYTGIKA
ncbi:MAG: MerR family transcriptional regulator [Peptococcia bacterium]|jgi:DNA-binding transcriptional MerR regulator